MKCPNTKSFEEKYGMSNTSYTTRLPRRRYFAMISFALPIIAITAGAASAADPPNGTQFTLSGCRNTGQNPLYLNPSTTNVDTDPLYCDPSVYTTGNLQKSWGELDLVPYRLTVSPGD